MVVAIIVLGCWATSIPGNLKATPLPTPPATVYVDDDFNASTPGWGSDHFKAIQNGINAVAENGTVTVFSGLYTHWLVVNKTIRLIGENKNTTIIDAGAHLNSVVGITANHVTISGFTIRESYYGYTYEQVVGIFSNSNTICGNIVQYGRDYGILIAGNNNRIVGNIIRNNPCGIFVQDGPAPTNNRIYHNNFYLPQGHAYDASYGNNAWHNGYPSGGNYWDGYTGQDQYSGPGQNISGGDGIGDAPYTISGGSNQDMYPLMHPWVPTCGDCNNDDVVDVGDVVYLINYLFKGGPVPQPLDVGDVNADTNVDVGDVVYLINYLFKGGPAPTQ